MVIRNIGQLGAVMLRNHKLYGVSNSMMGVAQNVQRDLG
jgi:hypothetical protein